MSRSGALCFAVALTLSGCSTEIVLGDSEAALPTKAGAPATNAGSASDMGGSAASGGGTTGDSGATSGSGPAQPDTAIPAQGELVWSTDFEVGDFSDWERGGVYYGGQYQWGAVNGYVDIGVGRNGSNGVLADINTGARGEPSGGVRMYRRIEPGPAYYRAWFRLEDAHTVADWWSIFLFHARANPLSLDNDLSFWDVRVVDLPGGQMALQFFDHNVMTGMLAGQKGYIAAREWFELSAYLDYRPPDATRLAIWINGTQLFDMKQLHTTVQPNVFWSVGNGGAKLDPPESTLDLDDAAIHKAGAP
jgi:hypothetical protein